MSPRGFAVEDVAGRPYLSTTALGYDVVSKALVVLSEVSVSRSFCEEVVKCWAWEGLW